MGWWSESREMVVAWASTAPPFCHVCEEDRVPLADHVHCGFLPISGLAQWLANRARRVRTQSRDRAVRSSWGALAAEQRARVIRHDASWPPTWPPAPDPACASRGSAAGTPDFCRIADVTSFYTLRWPAYGERWWRSSIRPFSFSVGVQIDSERVHRCGVALRSPLRTNGSGWVRPALRLAALRAYSARRAPTAWVFCAGASVRAFGAAWLAFKLGGAASR
jgi:hypothetical protein